MLKSKRKSIIFQGLKKVTLTPLFALIKLFHVFNVFNVVSKYVVNLPPDKNITEDIPSSLNKLGMAKVCYMSFYCL